MTETTQVIGGAQSARAGADDQHALRGVGARRSQLPATFDRQVTEKALNGVDADGLVDLGAVARRLARVKADAPHHGGKGILLDQLAPRSFVVS